MGVINGSGVVNDKGFFKQTWNTLLLADTGSVAVLTKWSDKTVQIRGTWGGATLVIQGSNDGGTTWTTLTDPQGNALSFTTGSPMEAIQENPERIRPSTSGGNGTTDLDVNITCTGPIQ